MIDLWKYGREKKRRSETIGLNSLNGGRLSRKVAHKIDSNKLAITISRYILFVLTQPKRVTPGNCQNTRVFCNVPAIFDVIYFYSHSAT